MGMGMMVLMDVVGDGDGDGDGNASVHIDDDGDVVTEFDRKRVRCLWNSEVGIILNHHIEQKRKTNPDVEIIP